MLSYWTLFFSTLSLLCICTHKCMTYKFYHFYNQKGGKWDSDQQFAFLIKLYTQFCYKEGYMQWIFGTDIVTTVMFMYDMGSGLSRTHKHLFFFMQTLPSGSVLTRTASFVNLRRYQKAGGQQDRQHEGEAEEDSLFTHILPVRVCVFSAWQRVGFQTVRGLVTWKR